MTRIGTRLDRIYVLAENRYLDSLSYGLQVSELWRNCNGHSAISRNLITDFRYLTTPLSGRLNVGFKVHNYHGVSVWFFWILPLASQAKTSTIAEALFKPRTQLLFPQLR